MSYRVMTVCTGNICRSPMAEVLLREAFAQAGLNVIVDSTGISDEEYGNPMDRRAVKVLTQHGYPTKPNHHARQVTAADLSGADLVIPMTSSHARALRRVAAAHNLNPDIKMMRWFDPAAPQVSGHDQEYLLDVDDPWYGGPREFDECLAELEAAVPGVVDYVRSQVT